MKPETKDSILGWLLFVGVMSLFIALSYLFCGCGTRRCCPQCEANRDELDYQWRVVEQLKCDVRDMKRGYVTVPVRVSITNAWEAVE